MNDLKRKVLALAAEDLDNIEAALNQNLEPYLDIVRDAASHILFSGGKRLRPLLMVLSARICGYNGRNAATYSVIFEYLHAASLLHDDLVDGAVLRRGKTAANLIYGNSIAVLVGDFLLARVLSIAANMNNMSIISEIGSITEKMSQGEIHQLIVKERLDLTEEEYMRVIQAKTAVLIQAACKVGALLAGGTAERVDALSRYGQHLGLAFQMADDLLDYTANTSDLGKEAGADLREGKLTLPVIHALKNASSQDRTVMKNIITNKTFTIHEFEKLKSLLQTYGGIQYTKDMANQHVETAKKALSVFSTMPLKEKDILYMLADYALSRSS